MLNHFMHSGRPTFILAAPDVCVKLGVARTGRAMTPM